MTKHIIVILFLFTSFLISGCDNSTKPDDIPPTIRIASPIDGSTVSEIVTVTAIASDNEGIKMVNLWVNGLPLEGSEDTSEPYELIWNTVFYDNSSSHTITVRAFDKSDNITDSDPIILTVDNISAVPTQLNFKSIIYDNFSFIITWSPSPDDDFDSYILYEASFADMSDASSIFTSNIRNDTTHTVTNVIANEKRYYQLISKDTVGLETSSIIRRAVALLIPTEGLLAYYPFNENSDDESGNNNHGTIYGATLTDDRSGNANSAYDFDGLDDYIDVGNPYSLQITNELTLSAWVNYRAFDSFSGIISKGLMYNGGDWQGAYGIGVSKNDFKPRFEIKTNLSLRRVLFGDTILHTDRWYHIAATFASGIGMKIYVDGELIDTLLLSDSQIIHATTWNNNDIRIGDSQQSQIGSGFQGELNGKVDEVRIYNRALSDIEVQALFQENILQP